MGTGQVYMEIDPVTSGFSSMVGQDRIEVDVPLYNGRGKGFTVDNNGFALVQHKCPDIDFTSEHAILTQYYPLAAEFIRQQMGAYKAYPFGHFVRSGKGTMKYSVENGQRIGGPAIFTHGDYALRGGPKRRDNFALPPANDDSFRSVYGDRPLIPEEELAELRGRRFAIVNLWRNIDPDHPLVDMPLCFCDASTARVEDYVSVEFRYVDRVIETYLGGYSEGQRWYYFPEVLRDEGILLKTYDSQGILCRDFVEEDGSPYPYFLRDQEAVNATSVLHSAVKDPRQPETAPTRRSIEMRAMIFY